MSAYVPIVMSGNGSSTPLMVRPEQNIMWQAAPAYSFGLVATLSPGGSLTYTVQVTADPIPSATGNWNNHDVLYNQTSSANSNIAYPITGLRLVVTGYSSGTITLGVARWP